MNLLDDAEGEVEEASILQGDLVLGFQATETCRIYQSVLKSIYQIVL